eukprot:6308156-Pyramimonas_sp.AAC.1
MLRQEYPELYVSERLSNTKCRFAGGEPKTAEAAATVPVQHLDVTTEFEVLNTGPEQAKATLFLLGNPQLKNSKITGTTIELKTSSVGHYRFSLMLLSNVAAVAEAPEYLRSGR